MCETKLLQRWYDEVWNNAKENAIDELLDENAIIHGLDTDKGQKGPVAFKPFYKTLRETLPSVSIKLEPIVKSDDIEAAHCFVSAKDAEGKDVSFSGLTIARFKDGKIVEGWNGFDFVPLYQQLGYKLTKEI